MTGNKRYLTICVLSLLVALFGWVCIVNAEGDTAGPAVSQLSPNPGAVINTSNPGFALRFSDPAQLASPAIIRIDGQEVSSIITWDPLYELQEDTCTGQMIEVFIGEDYANGVINAQFSQLQAGEHTVSYKLQDKVGNITEDSYSFSITDNESPQISQQTPTNNSSPANPNGLIISARINDASTIDSASINLTVNETRVDAAFDPISSRVTYIVPGTLRNGLYRINLTAADVFGNPCSSSWSFPINDQAPPTISGLNPENNSLTGSTTPLIEANIYDVSGIISPVIFLLDNNRLEVQYNAASGKASYRPPTPLAQGQHTVNLMVYDFQGNMATKAWNFSVETTGPSVSQLSPAPGSSLAAISPQFSLRFEDNHELDASGVVIKVDGQAVNATVKWDQKVALEEDTCTGDLIEVMVDDYTKGTVTAQLPRFTSGQHTIAYSLRDSLGNTTQSSYNYSITDTDAPQITQQSPVSGATLTSPTPIIKAKVVEPSGINVESLVMTINGTKVNATFNPITSEVTYIVPQALKNGSYVVHLALADIFGNSATSSWNFIISDTTPPTVSGLTPVNGSKTGVTRPLIEAVINDISGVVNPVYLMLDDRQLELSYNSSTGKVSYMPENPLSQGQHSVTLQVYDFQGNKALAAWAFSVETAGPGVSQLTPVPGSTIPAIAPQFSMRFEDPNELDPASVVLKINGQLVNPTVSWDKKTILEEDTCTGDMIEIIVDDYTKGIITAQLPRFTEGEHTVYYSLKDRLGNLTESSYIYLVADENAPQITLQSPVSGATIANPKPTITAKVSDISGIDGNSINLSINGVQVNAAFDPIISTVTYNVPNVLLNGPYSVQLSAADVFGNRSSATWSFTLYENTPPTITSLVPANNGVTGSTSPNIEATLSDASGIANPVYMQLDNSSFELQYNGQSGKVSFAPAVPLSTGQHSVSLWVYDVQGNKASAAWSFSIQQAGPIVSQISPAPDSSSATLSSKFSMRFDDVHELDPNVTVKIDNQVLNPTIIWDGLFTYEEDSCNGGLIPVRIGDDFTKGEVTAPIPQLGGGQHTVYYLLKDRQGNATEGSYTFTVSDVEGPQLTELSPANGVTISNGKPVITAKLSDANAIVAESITLEINGSPVICTYNSVTRTVSCQVTQLLPKGLNNFQLKAEDWLGNSSTHSWRLYVNDTTVPLFSLLSPANGTIVGNFTPKISARITDLNGIKAETVTLSLDGIRAGSFDEATGMVSHTPAASLTLGQHTVVISAEDKYGNPATASWAFTVKDLNPPEIINPLPPPTMGTRATRPTISVQVRDLGGIDLTKSTIQLDGVILNATFTPGTAGSNISGTLSAVPPAELTNAMHTAVVTVYDLAGASQQKTWQFGVNVFGDMYSDFTNCMGCHNNDKVNIDQRHLAFGDNCAACHGGDCTGCHSPHTESWPPPVSGTGCTGCHNATAIHAPNEITHNFSGLAQDCLACHSSILTRAHNIYVEGRGVAYDCYTCHMSSKPEVIQAINNSDLDCGACHGSSIDHESVHVNTLDTACASCHSTNLTADHLTNRPELGYDCNTCHGSSDSSVRTAIISGSVACSSCHSQGHSLSIAENFPEDIPLYAGFSWSTPMKAALWLGEPWMPDEFTDTGRVLVSSRRADVSVSQVWSFYREALATEGWTLTSPEPAAQDQFFAATFSKGSRKVKLYFYSGETHGTSGGLNKYRLEILYK